MFSFFKRKAKSTILGVEVRADGLAFAVATHGKQKPDIVTHCAYVECNAAERKKALQSFVTDNKLSGALCRVVLPPGQYKVYPVEKPKVEDNELGAAVHWKVKDLIDYDISDAVTDVFEFPDDALRGRPEQVNVVVARSAIIKETVSLIQSADLHLDTIDIAELALRNIASRVGDDDERAVSVLYLRHGAGLMILAKGNTLYFSRQFDFSLQALNDVSQQDSVIQNLALEIQRSFDYFESQMGQVPPQIVHLVGPAPNMPLANMLGGGIAARVELVDLSMVREGESVVALEDIQALVAAGAALRDEVA